MDNTIDTTKGRIDFKKNVSLTSTWEALEQSDEGLKRFNVKSRQNVGLWMKGLLNSSDVVQIRLACYLSADDAEVPFYTHIQTVGSTEVSFSPEIITVNTPTIEMVIPLGITELVPYLEIEAMVVTEGATAAVITDAYVTFEGVK